MCTFLNNISRNRNPNVFDLRLIALFHFIYWLGNRCCFVLFGLSLFLFWFILFLSKGGGGERKLLCVMAFAVTLKMRLKQSF